VNNLDRVVVVLLLLRVGDYKHQTAVHNHRWVVDTFQLVVVVVAGEGSSSSSFPVVGAEEDYHDPAQPCLVDEKDRAREKEGPRRYNYIFYVNR
jgi:hypothetical protein